MPLILIVCTGNICRSPAAEVLLRARLEREGLDDWVVASAGTWTVDGRPASRHMVHLLAGRGLDLSGHGSQPVNRHLMEQAALVLVMTHGHAEALRLEFPAHAAKVFLLSEMKDGRRFDVEDPYGGSLEEYQDCLKELDDLIGSGFERIRTLVEKNAASTSPR